MILFFRLFFPFFEPFLPLSFCDLCYNTFDLMTRSVLMQIDFSIRENDLVLSFYGEMDHLSAIATRKAVDKLIDEHLYCDEVIFDLQHIQFMDSTGIGFLIGRYKKLKRLSIPLFLTNITPETDKVLSLSGIYTLIPKTEGGNV